MGLVATAAAAGLLMALIGEVIAPVVVFMLLFAGLAVGIARRARRWLLWAAAVLPAVLLALNAPYAISDLSHPESVGGFVPTLVLVVSASTTVVLATIAALDRRAPAGRVWGAVAAATLLLAGVSVVGAAGLADDPAQPGDVPIAAEAMSFPDRVTLTPDDGALLVSNADPIHHTLVVEGSDVHVDLPGSAVRRVELDLPSGTYRYFCDVPGHEGMEGTLVVR